MEVTKKHTLVHEKSADEPNDFVNALQQIFSTEKEQQALMRQIVAEISKVSKGLSINMDIYFGGRGIGLTGLSDFEEHQCIIRRIGGDPWHAIIFTYPNSGGYMAVIRAKKKYFDDAIASLKAPASFVKSHRLIHRGKEENYYLCSLQVGDPTSDAEIKNVDNFFKHTQNLYPLLNVGQAMNEMYKECKSDIEGLPPHFRLQQSDIAEVLGPKQEKLFDFDEMKNPSEEFDISVNSYPYVFTGLSGSGKTVSALLLSKGHIYGATEGKACPIVGIYVAEGAKIFNVPGKIASNKAVGEAIGREICDHCNKHPESARVKDLTNTLFYVVLDEMGKCKEATRTIIQSTIEVQEAIRAHLTRNQFSNARGCRFVFSVVGAGIRPPIPCGSLPREYKLWRPRHAAGEVFVRVLSQKSGCNSATSLAYLNAVRSQPSLQALLATTRCEALLAECIAQLLVGVEGVNPLHTDLVAAQAAHLEVTTITRLIYLTGWGKLSSDQQIFYAKWVISLVFTQPHGFHLLHADAVEMLVTSLGAIDDHLTYERFEGRPEGNPGPSHSHGYLPKDLQFPIVQGRYMVRTETIFSEEIGHDIAIRFEVPPVSFIIAVNIVARISGSGSALLPKVYEKVVASMLHAMLETFTWFAAHESSVVTNEKGIGENCLGSFSVPLRYLLPNAPSTLQKEQLVLHIPKMLKPENKDDWAQFESNCINHQWKMIDASHLCTTEFDYIVADTWAQVQDRGVAVVLAGDETPSLSDITLFTKHQCIGIETKDYADGGLVKLSLCRSGAIKWDTATCR